MEQDTNYDDFAAAYSRDNEANLVNAYYERPAMIELAGDVAGRRILDIGCGSGPLAEALVKRGAEVAGFDASHSMINLARQRLGGQADLRVARLGEALPYEDHHFDDAVASLVFHYLPAWDEALREVCRVLRPGGRLIVSVNHPILYPWTHPGADYFLPTRYTDDFEFDGKAATLTYWHRPLHEIMNDFITAGFTIERVWEPPYSKDAPTEIVPEQLRDREAFLSFIFFALRSGPSSGE